MRLLSFVWLMVAVVGTAALAQTFKKADDSKPAAPAVDTPKADAGVSRAHQILERADAATKKVKSVKYSLHAQRTDVSDRLASKLSGTVIMSGWHRGHPAKFRYEVETRPGGSDETATVVVGYDGEQFWALNMRDKKIFAGEDLASIGAYQMLVEFFPVTEFVLSEPFGDELHARKQEFLGTAKVNGEPCAKIHTIYSNPGQEATWYISTKDYLPRRVDRLIIDPDGASLTRSSVISDLVVDPEVDEQVFSLTIPSDFIKAKGATP